MFTSLENIIGRYKEKLTRGPQTKLISFKKRWPTIAKKHHIDNTHVIPIGLSDKKLTLSCSSSEEAAQVRMLQRQLIKTIKDETNYTILEITFK